MTTSQDFIAFYFLSFRQPIRSSGIVLRTNQCCGQNLAAAALPWETVLGSIWARPRERECMEAAKIGRDLRLREPRAKILSRLMQTCVFTPPSKSFLRLSALSICSPYSNQIDFFDFGMKDNLENDLVGVEPVVSICRLTVVCLMRLKTTARVWYLTPLPTQHMSLIFSRVNFFKIWFKSI